MVLSLSRWWKELENSRKQTHPPLDDNCVQVTAVDVIPILTVPFTLCHLCIPVLGTCNVSDRFVRFKLSLSQISISRGLTDNVVVHSSRCTDSVKRKQMEKR